MKRLLLSSLLCLAVVLGASPAVASPPEDAGGEWTYVVRMDELTFREAGNTTFIHAVEDSTFTGTFDGTAVDEGVVICHERGNGSIMSYAKLLIHFTGEVHGREGDLTIMATGKQDTQTCLPSDAVWYGTWVIVGGSGELADLHGHGTWTGPSFDLDYAGSVHFD